MSILPWRVSRVLGVMLAVLLVGACADSTPTEIAHTPPESSARISVPIVGDFTSVTSSYGGYCSITVAGSVACFGDLEDDPGVPIHVAANGARYVAMTNIANNFCAVTSLGDANCWGGNVFFTAPSTLTPSSGAFVDINGLCALRDDRALECFRPATTTTVTSQTYTATTGWFVKPLWTNWANACGLRSDGAVECIDARAPELYTPEPVTVATTGRFVDAAASDGALICALRDDGVVECWGATLFGEYFRNTYAASQGSYRQVSTGDYSVCALRTDGLVDCNGGESNALSQTRPSSNGLPFVEISVKGRFVCARRSDNAIECWKTSGISTEFTSHPTATLNAPASVLAGSTLTLTLTNPQIPGRPGETGFEYSFFCGVGVAIPRSTSNTATCVAPQTSSMSVYGTVYDRFGDRTLVPATIVVKTATQGATDLRTAVATSALLPDLRKPLTVKLDAALAAIAAGDKARACSALSDFINQVRAQRGKAIATLTADLWIQEATSLRTALGC